MSLALIKNTEFRPQSSTLEQCLEELCKYGEPMLYKTKSGWNLKIAVFVTGEGVKFEVGSEYGCNRPSDAAAQCYDRLIEAIKKIKGAT